MGKQVSDRSEGGPAAVRPRRRRVTHRAMIAAVAGVALTVATPSVGGATPLLAAPGHAAARATTAIVRQVVVAKSPRLPGGVTELGALPSGRTVSGVVALAPRNAAVLQRFASAISTPGTSAYHRYLTPATFTNYFSPSRTAVAAIERHLSAGGLSVSSVSSNRLLVGFTGRAAAVAATFHTSFATYRLAGGRRAFANTSAIRLPATIAPLVTAVVGLNDLVVPHATPVRSVAGRHASARTRADALHVAETATTTAGGPVACRAATRAAGGNGGFTDTQIADAYGVDGLYQKGDIGAGQTVALYELEPYRTIDVKAFDSCYFGAADASSMLTRLHTVAVDGGDPTGPGSGESELDIDDVSALAPGANIEVYEAPATNAGYLDDWNAIVSDDTAKTVSSSWGSSCETETAAEEPGLEQVENTIFEQAAIQGQTVLDATGDSGADGCSAETGEPTTPLLSANDPASQPYVLAVGGTTIDQASNPPVEQTWNDGGGGGAGGGGISAVWPQPAWQAHSTVAGIDAAKVIAAAQQIDGGDFCQTAEVKTACRELPDVSANADEYTGITIDYDRQWTTIGGTSSSTPLWAAILADIDSTASCKAHGGVGFVNPSLYAIASVPSEYKASFNDVTTANNDEYGITDGLYPATRGYDMATGLGTPRVTGRAGTNGLAYYLCAAPATSRPTVSSISPDVVSSAAGSGTGAAGAAVSVTITGSHFEAAGAPDVAGITVGSYQVTPFTVVSSSTITATLPIAVVEEGNGGTGSGSGVFDVTVTLNGGLTSMPTSSARLTVYNDPSDAGSSVPVVDAVTPSGGNEVGGTVIHIYGSGFTALSQTSTVTIGGVSATVTKVTDTELTAVVPPYAASGPSATTCVTATNPVNDVCQTQVEVTNHFGSSAISPILPEYAGDLYTPPSAGTEALPATTEFDYVPTPTVTGYTFVDPAQDYASEEGFSYITGAENEVIVHGTGLGQLGFEWADVGTPGTSAAIDDEVLSVTPTALDLYLPNISLTDRQMVEALAMQTLGSPNQATLTSTQEPSPTVPVTYAPVPRLHSYSTASGKDFSPTAGGTKVTVKGVGFYDGALVTFTNYNTFTVATEYNLDPSATAPHRQFSFVTTPQLPGEDATAVCTVSGCSGDTEVCIPGVCIVESFGTHPFTFYPPGKPSLVSIQPKTGRAGDFVTITGTNLAFPQAVYFGSKKLNDDDFGNGFNDETGAVNLNVVQALVPRGLQIGKKVDIRVVTAESEATERHPETPINKNVTYTVTKPFRRQS
jgi:subtilase family serine protease